MDTVQILYSQVHKNKKRGLVVYPPGAERLSLSGSELRIYLYLLQHINSDDTIEASYNSMASYLNLDRKSIMNGIKSLEKKMLLQRFTRLGEDGAKAVNTYKLFQPILPE